MKVHDGKDEDDVGLDTVKHAIRKTMDEAPTDTVGKLKPHCRVIDGVLDGGICFSCEV